MGASVFLLGLPAVVSAALARSRQDDFPISLCVALFALLAAGLIVLAASSYRPERVLPLLAVAVLIVWPETLLRLIGFRYDPSPMVIEFGLTDPEQMAGLERDPDLFWRLRPGEEGVNSIGFRGPEVAIPKPPGVVRILFFGDSCTWQGFTAPIAKLLGIRLRGAMPAERTFETVNLGVPGYSSYQGRRLAALWAPRLEPDLAVVYYGWNDHWLATGASDSKKGARGRLDGLIVRLVSRSRLLQLVLKISGGPKALSTPRVSASEYRENLEAIGATIESAGGRVILVTAPSAHARTGVPQYLIRRGLASSAENVLAWHREYNNVVRSVARSRGWFLVDLEAGADELPDPSTIFLEDGIHFTTPLGLRWVAYAFVDAIGRDVLSEPAASKP